MAIITTREVGATAKGSTLSNAEIDNNFINLNTDIATRIPSTEKGAANGVATLDASGLVPTAQLPSYVDDVVEAANLASFPATGETGKIYVARDTNKTYRWSGSTYIYITSGAVDSVAGKTGVVTLSNSDVGLGNVENKSSATIRGELNSGNVTAALGYTPLSNATSYLPLSGGTLTGSLSIQGTTATSVLKLYVSGSSQWSLGVGDASGTNFGIACDFGTFSINKGTGNVTTPGQFYAGSTNVVLHAGNYSSYSPTLTGGGASGTWGINISGAAASAVTLSNNASISGLNFGGVLALTASGASTGNATGARLTESYGPQWNLGDGSTWHYQILNGSLLVGISAGGTNYGSGNIRAAGNIYAGASNLVLHAGNYSSYALPLSGGSLTGSLLIGSNGTNTAYGAASTGKLYFGSSGSDAPDSYYVGTNIEDYGGSYSKLDIKWYTGQRFYAAAIYGGFRFHDIISGSEVFSINKGDSNARVSGNVVLHAGNYTNYSIPRSEFRSFGDIVIDPNGQNATCTTAQFMAHLSSLGFFNYASAVGKCVWNYAGNNDLTDTGFGTIDLAGCVIETWKSGNEKHVRLTRPTTGAGGYQVLVYVDHGSGYSPGWRAFITSENIGSQSVSYATSAGSATDSTKLPLTGGTLTGALNVARQRLSFSSSYNDANHSIYNNYTNIDGEGVFDGMKMNVYDGLRIRVGNASGTTPVQAFGIDAAGSVWMPRGVTLGSRTNTSTFGGNDAGMSGNSFVAEVRANGAKPTLTFHYENVATTHIEHLSDGSLNVWRPAVEGTSVFKIGNNTALHAGNYTSYAVANNGSSWTPHPSSTRSASWNYFYTDYGYISLGPANGGWAHIYSDKNFYFNNGIWIADNRVLDAGNYSSYALPLSGGTISGSLIVNHAYGSSVLENGNGLVINGNYTNGQYSHRWRKWDDGGGVPLYLQLTGGTANSWSNLARFGTLTGDGNFLRVFGPGRFDGSLTENGNQVLHAGNYSSYALPLSGDASRSGTTSLSGVTIFNNYISLNGDFYHNGNQYVLNAAQNGWINIVARNGGNPFINNVTYDGNTILHAANYTSYAFKAEGTFAGDIDADRGQGVFTLDPVPSGTPPISSPNIRTLNIGPNFARRTQLAFPYEYDRAFFRRRSDGGWNSWREFIHDGNYNNYSPTLTGGGASGTWGINVTGSAGSASTAANISNTGTVTLASATEANSIFITQPSYSTDMPIKLLNFDWYGNVFSMGNIRSGATPTNGFGVYYTASGGSRTEIARFGTSGNLRVASNLQQGADMARPLAQWSATSATGMVYFELPGNTGNYGMVHAVIDIYEYNSNAVSTVIVGGHNWNGAWYNVAANVIGQTDKAVRLGTRGGKYVICIGSAGSSWSYGTVVLRKIHNGGYYSGIMDMGAAFVAAITTTESLTSDTGDLRALRTPSSFNAGGAITQAGNQVLHAGNYTNYTDGRYVYARGQSNWNDGTVINNVVGMLAWKNYSNGHVIFDASNGTTPSGTSCSTTNPQNNWTGSYPTLMGWNGANTYGVRVDSARVADSAAQLNGIDSSNYFRTDGSYPNTDMNSPVEGYWHVIYGASNSPEVYYGHRWDYDHLNNGQWVAQMYSPTSGDPGLWFRQRRDYQWQTWRKFLDSSNYNSYSPTLTGGGASGTWGISITGNAVTAGYLPAVYAGGQQTNPQVYFNENIGLKVAMTGVPNVWSDTLWINGYSGADVPNMCALHTIRNGTPRMWISSQSNRATSYGTMYEFLSTYNYNSYSPTLTGGGASGSWGISVTGSAASVNLSGHTITNSSWAGGAGYHGYQFNGGNWRFGFSSTAGVVDVYADGNFYATDSSHLVLHASNYSSYALPLNGGTMSGTIFTTAASAVVSQQGGATRGYLYGDSAGFGFLTNSGNWAARVDLGTANFTVIGNIAANSDERLKKDWAALPADFIKRLAAVKNGTYTRIDSGDRQAGSSAQDWQNLLPEVVTKATDEDQTLSLVYGNAALVSAIELAKDNCELRARIERLESLIEQLLNKE